MTAVETGRRTDVGSRVTSLEGLRALAVGAVTITHAGFLAGVTGGTVLPGLVARLDIGVPVFFVLSGFLLYLPHARAGLGAARPPQLRDYLVRRAARLLPAWLLVLAATYLLVPQARAAEGSHWVANLLMVQTWRVDWQVPGLNHLWSLSTEAAFYLALPPLAWLVHRLSRRSRSATLRRDPRREVAVLLALVPVAWLWRVLVSTESVPVDISALQWLPGHLDWFAVGMVLAVLRVRALAGEGQAAFVRDVVVGAATWLRVAAACLLWLATTSLAGPVDLSPTTTDQDLVKHLAYLAIATLVVAPTALGGTDGFSRWLGSPVMSWLGTISYGVFLWHLPVLYVVRRVLGLEIFQGGFWLSWSLTVSITIVVASLSWYLLEHPLLAQAHRATPRAPDPVPVGRA